MKLKNIDIVLLFNGLGNQMSQYAFYLAKREKNKNVQCIYYPSTYDNQHNGYELDKVFGVKIKKNIKYNFAVLLYRLYLSRYNESSKGKYIRKILKYFDIKVIYENFSTHEFIHSYLNNNSGITFYYGGWHNENYFNLIRNKILKTYSFTVDKADSKINTLVEEIRKKNSVSLHIRRGDYQNKELKSVFGNVCDLDYYKEAINYINEKVKNPYFYIFSDDKDWVTENFKLLNSQLVDFNKGADSWKDLFLISLCKHNINANSTFSWWGAWLNNNQDKITIVPNKFSLTEESENIYPESWIKLNVSSSFSK